ncbi:MAG TPA: pre-peptidase C-terminal domain-containing protein, partial [Polyangia bacterium]
MRSLWSASAAAQSYYWPENKPGTPGAMATYVYVASAYLPANTTYTFETRNLSLGANTVMHLTYNSLTNEVAYNDDCPNSGSLRSCFTYRTPVAGTYYVIVYAYDANSGGRGGKTFDMYINNAVYAANVRLGGYVIYTTQGNWESMETVLVNDGAPATSLTRLDWNAGAGHYKPAAVDWTYGVGNASKLFGNGSSKWVVASASAATREGPVRVMRNDALLPNDSDGDGLGDNLERELCTCASKQAGIVCGFDCSTVVDPRDTDGDGLRDDWEAIGVDDPTNPQLFPLWGASPRHKDVFVEIDRSNWTGNQGQQFLDSDAQAAAQRYAALTGMGNPDGVDGIAVHFDVDHTCTETGDVDGISKVCGQFGGAGLLSTDPGCVPGSNMASIRGGKFHWGLLKTNAGGTTPVTPGQSFCFGPDPVWATAAHELGHNLGLQHWGVDAAGIANTKPNYPSLMNYAYSYKLNGGDVNSIAFSDGSRAGVPLNPRNLTEVSTYPVGVNIDFLAAEPFAFPRSGNGLDWNRDGDYNGSVRAHISPEPEYRDWGDGAADQPVNMSWQTLSTLVPTAGLGAAGAVTWDPIEQMFFNATFVIAQDPATYQYNYAYTIALTGGWSGWNLVGTATHDVNSAPAAAVLNTIPNGDLLFIFGATGGAIHYATVDLYRNVSAWSTPFTNPPGVAFSEVSVTPYSGPAGSVLFLVARDRSGTPNNVW